MERGREGCCDGGGGADGAITKTCLSMSTHACNEFKKRAGASALVPSAGLTSRKKGPYACSLRRQVKGVPSANLPKAREKDCEARPPHPPLLRRKGRANFSIVSTLYALVRNEHRRCSWPCLPGKRDPLPKFTSTIQKITER